MNLPKCYLRLEEELNRMIKARSGCVVVGLPGMGVSHFLEIFVRNNKLPEEVEVVNPNFLADEEEAIIKTMEVYRKTGVGKKIILGVNAPSVLYRPELMDVSVASRWSGQYYLAVRDKEDLQILMTEIGVELSKTEFEKMAELSGGVARLAKFFGLNREMMKTTVEELAGDEKFNRLLKPFVDEAAKCKPEWLFKMRLTDSDGKWIPRHLGGWVARSGGLALCIGGGIYLVEMGERGEALLPHEVKLVERLMANKGIITKDEIAKIIWGEKEDGVSDQAITKAMQRLGVKFGRYQLAALPKIGYELKKK